MKIKGMPPEHDFTQKREDWEGAVFRNADHFSTFIPGDGIWYVKTFKEAIDKAGDNPRALVYAISKSGLSVVMPRDKWK